MKRQVFKKSSNAKNIKNDVNKKGKELSQSFTDFIEGIGDGFTL